MFKFVIYTIFILVFVEICNLGCKNVWKISVILDTIQYIGKRQLNVYK